MDTVPAEITQAEGTPAAATQETTPIVPETPTMETLQSRITEQNKLIANLEAQTKGRARENAKLNQALQDRKALKQELSEEVARVVREHISALGEVLFADEEPENQQPPSKKQLLQQRLKPSEKANPAPVDQEGQQQYEKALRYLGRIDGALEESGLKLTDLPEEVVAEAKELHEGGNTKGAFEVIRAGVTDYQKKRDDAARQRQAKEKQEREQKASLVTIERVPGGGTPASGSIEVLRKKLLTNQHLSPEEYQKLDAYNEQRLKDMAKGSL